MSDTTFTETIPVAEADKYPCCDPKTCAGCACCGDPNKASAPCC